MDRWRGSLVTMALQTSKIVPSTSSDTVLIRRSAVDAMAFDALLARHIQTVHDAHEQHAPTPQTALQMTAETCCRAWFARQAVEPPFTRDGRGWLLAIAEEVDTDRTTPGVATYEATDRLGVVVPRARATSDVERPAAETEQDLSKRASAALAELPIGLRRVVQLHIIERRPALEVSMLLHMSVNEVRSQAERGVARIGHLLHAAKTPTSDPVLDALRAAILERTRADLSESSGGRLRSKSFFAPAAMSLAIMLGTFAIATLANTDAGRSLLGRAPAKPAATSGAADSDGTSVSLGGAEVTLDGTTLLDVQDEASSKLVTATEDEGTICATGKFGYAGYPRTESDSMCTDRLAPSWPIGGSSFRTHDNRVAAYGIVSDDVTAVEFVTREGVSTANFHDNAYAWVAEREASEPRSVRLHLKSGDILTRPFTAQLGEVEPGTAANIVGASA